MSEMKEIAIKSYESSFNCSQCILKAAEEVYGLEIHEQCYRMCQCCNNGLGVGSTCAALEAGLFVFGLLFDEYTCIRLRMKLMTLLQCKYGSIYCQKLKAKMEIKNNDCSKIIGETASIIGQIIDDELNK